MDFINNTDLHCDFRSTADAFWLACESKMQPIEKSTYQQNVVNGSKGPIYVVSRTKDRKLLFVMYAGSESGYLMCDLKTDIKECKINDIETIEATKIYPR